MTGTLGFLTCPLSRDRIARFSEAMHDVNPVHLDDAFCRSVGLAGIIAPGGVSVVALAHDAVLLYGLDSVTDIDVTFRSPIRAGESLRCVHEVLEDGRDAVVLSVVALADDGRVCAEGRVRAVRREGPHP